MARWTILLLVMTLGACAGASRYTDDAGWTWTERQDAEGFVPPEFHVKALLPRGPHRNQIRELVFRDPSGAFGFFPRKAAASGRFSDDYFVFYTNGRNDSDRTDFVREGWYLGDRVDGHLHALACPDRPKRPAARDEPSQLYWSDAAAPDGLLADTLVLVCRFGGTDGAGQLVYQLRDVEKRLVLDPGKGELKWVESPDRRPLALWQRPDGTWSADVAPYLESLAQQAHDIAARRKVDGEKHWREVQAENQRKKEADARNPYKRPLAAGAYCLLWGFHGPWNSTLPRLLLADLTITRAASAEAMEWRIRNQLANALGNRYGTFAAEMRIAPANLPEGSIPPPFGVAVWMPNTCDKAGTLPPNDDWWRVRMTYP